MKLWTTMLVIAILLAGCGTLSAPADTPTPLPSDTPVPPTPTDTPTPEPTTTPLPTATNTPAPTPTEAPCSHVDLNGRYVDFRNISFITYGWEMYVVQNGCEITARETFYKRALGPTSQSETAKLTGTIDGDKVRICYVSSGYCLNLVIMDGGEVLANGIEGWHYEKSVE